MLAGCAPFSTSAAAPAVASHSFGRSDRFTRNTPRRNLAALCELTDAPIYGSKPIKTAKARSTAKHATIKPRTHFFLPLAHRNVKASWPELLWSERSRHLASVRR